VNGVRVFFERMSALGRDVRELAPVRLAAIGPETARELERRHLHPAIVPQDARAEGLLAAFGTVELAGARILLPRAAGARAVLPDTLRERGAVVDEVIAYEAIPPEGADVEALQAALRAGVLDVLTFTSSSTVRHFVSLAGDALRAALAGGRRPLVACIGPVTATTARELGVPVDVIPDAYTVAALVDAITARFCNPADDPLSREAR
jgi:uroporphyrinogen III methyltransferase/synthase